MKKKWWVLMILMTLSMWLGGCKSDPDKPHYPEPIFPGPM